jgi:hypothetical protein
LPIFNPKKFYNPLSPPCSPDLSPPDYFLFPKLKIKVKALHFADVAEIRETVTDEKEGPKSGTFSSFSENVRLRKSLYICQ